jgi:hypothetical protein
VARAPPDTALCHPSWARRIPYVYRLKGFANPLASQAGADSIGFAVQVSTPTAAQVQAGPPDSIPMYLWATYTQADGNDTDYQITVPAKYAGKRYVLLLAGTARVGQPSAPTLPFVHEGYSEPLGSM